MFGLTFLIPFSAGQISHLSRVIAKCGAGAAAKQREQSGFAALRIVLSAYIIPPHTDYSSRRGIPFLDQQLLGRRNLSCSPWVYTFLAGVPLEQGKLQNELSHLIHGLGLNIFGRSRR